MVPNETFPEAGTHVERVVAPLGFDEYVCVEQIFLIGRHSLQAKTKILGVAVKGFAM